ncbi:MAG: hypothetical protein ACFE95_09855 [Candidatus Hodarchaeota archaeon]
MIESRLLKKIFKMIDESGLPNSDDPQIVTNLEKKQAELIDKIYEELDYFIELEGL